MAEDIIFEGDWNLDKAYQKFETFISKVSNKIDAVNKSSAQTTSSNSANQQAKSQKLLNKEYEITAKLLGRLEKAGFNRTSAAIERMRQASDKGLVSESASNSARNQAIGKLQTLSKRFTDLQDKVEKNGKATKADILQLRKLTREYDNLDIHLEKVERNLAKTSTGFQKSQQAAAGFFKGLVIGGFALQQFGGLMNRYLTQPLFEAGQRILDIGLTFDKFDETLKTVGGRSSAEIDKIYLSLKRVAELPNIRLEEATELYTKIFEATEGNIELDILEKVGQGLSRVLGSVESTERRGFYGQLIDILGGGDASNLQKTLAGVPRLLTQFNKLKREAELQGLNLDNYDLLTRSLAELADKPVIDSIANKIDNLSDKFVFFGQRVFKIYEGSLLKVITFAETKVIPTIDKLINYLENADQSTKNIAITITGLLAVLAPLTFALGTLSVVAGGIYYLFTAAASGIAVLTGNVLATRIATSSLTSLLSKEMTGGILGQLLSSGGILTKIPKLLSVANIAITAIIATVAYLVKNNLGGLQDTLVRLGKEIGENLYRQFASLGQIVGAVVTLMDRLSIGFDVLANTSLGKGVLSVIGATLGYIAEGLVYLNSLINMTLPMLGAFAQFVTDAFDLGLTAALYRLQIALLEIQKAVLPDFIAAWAGYDKMIADITQKLNSLGVKSREQEVLDKKSISDKEKLTEETEKLGRATRGWQRTIESINEAIQKQNDALKNNVAALREKRYEESLGRKIGALQTSGSIIDTYSEDTDYSNPVSVQQERDRINAQANSDKIIALARDEAARQKAMRESVDDTITSLDVIASSLDGKLKPTVQKVLNRYKINLKLYADGVEQLQDLSDEVSKSLNVKDVISESDKLQTLFPLLNAFDEATRKRFESITPSSAEQEAVEYARRIKIAELNRKQIDALRQSNTESAAIDAQQLIEGAKVLLEKRQEELVLAEEKISTEGDFVTNLERYFVVLSSVFDQEKQVLELEHSLELLKTEGQAEIANVKKRQGYEKENLDKEQERRRQNYRKDYLKSILDNENEILNLIDITTDAVARSALKMVELEIALARVGGSSDAKFAGFIGSIESAPSRALNKPFEDLLAKLVKFSSIIPQGATQKANDSVNDFLPTLSQAFSTLSQIDLSKFVSEGEKLIPILMEAYSFLSPERTEEKAQILVIIDSLTDSIDKARAATEKASATAIQQAEKNAEYSLAKLEYEQAISDEQDRQVRILRELFEEQQKRLGTNNGIIGGLLDILSNGSKQRRELEEMIIEREKESAEIQYQITLARLQLEEQIYLIKLEEAKLAGHISQEEIEATKERFEKIREGLTQTHEYEKELLEERLKNLEDFSGNAGQILLQGIGRAITGIFDKKEAKPVEDSEDRPKAVLSSEAAKETEESGKKQVHWLDKLDGKMKTTAKFIGAMGAAILELEEISVKAIARLVKEELNALASKFLIKSLEFAAVALSALVFGDFGAAAKAGAASAAWLGAAAAAKAGAGLLGLVDGNESAVSSSQANRQSGVSDNEETQSRLIKQKAIELNVMFDIRMDEGILLKKHIALLNQNTEVATLTLNSQSGFAFPPT